MEAADPRRRAQAFALFLRLSPPFPCSPPSPTCPFSPPFEFRSAPLVPLPIFRPTSQSGLAPLARIPDPASTAGAALARPVPARPPVCPPSSRDSRPGTRAGSGLCSAAGDVTEPCARDWLVPGLRRETWPTRSAALFVPRVFRWSRGAGPWRVRRGCGGCRGRRPGRLAVTQAPGLAGAGKEQSRGDQAAAAWRGRESQLRASRWPRGLPGPPAVAGASAGKQQSSALGVRLTFPVFALRLYDLGQVTAACFHAAKQEPARLFHRSTKRVKRKLFKSNLIVRSVVILVDNMV